MNNKISTTQESTPNNSNPISNINENSTSESTAKSVKFYIHRLNNNVTKNNLQRAFSKYGTIDEHCIRRTGNSNHSLGYVKISGPAINENEIIEVITREYF